MESLMERDEGIKVVALEVDLMFDNIGLCSSLRISMFCFSG